MKASAARRLSAISSRTGIRARGARIASWASGRRSRRTRPGLAWLTSTTVSRVRKWGTRATSTLR
jgi:hypothetical protein